MKVYDYGCVNCKEVIELFLTAEEEVSNHFCVKCTSKIPLVREMPTPMGYVSGTRNRTKHKVATRG